MAGIPPTKTCMNCHSQIFKESPTLEPVRASWRNGTSIEWVKVHDLPDFVYFNHSAHVNKGVGCTTCHGPVDKMAYVWQEKSLLMEWCLDCHRQPEKYLRPKGEVYSVAWQPPAEPARARAQARGGVRRQDAGHLLHVPPMSQEHVPAVPVEFEGVRRSRAAQPAPLLEEPRRARATRPRSSSSCTASSPSRPRCSRTRRAAASS